MLSQTDLGNKISVKLDIEGIFKNLFMCVCFFLFCFLFFVVFFFQDFLSWTLMTHRAAGVWIFFLSSTHEHSDIYFVTLHVRWLSCISNPTACIYQASTRWDSPPYQVTIWVIDNVMLIFVCLLVDLIQVFCYIY